VLRQAALDATLPNPEAKLAIPMAAHHALLNIIMPARL
jgi:hypothetical protein